MATSKNLDKLNASVGKLKKVLKATVSPEMRRYLSTIAAEIKTYQTDAKKQIGQEVDEYGSIDVGGPNEGCSALKYFYNCMEELAGGLQNTTEIGDFHYRIYTDEVAEILTCAAAAGPESSSSEPNAKLIAVEVREPARDEAGEIVTDRLGPLVKSFGTMPNAQQAWEAFLGGPRVYP